MNPSTMNPSTMNPTELNPEEVNQAIEQAKAELKKLLEQGKISQEDYQTSLTALDAEIQP